MEDSVKGHNMDHKKNKHGKYQCPCCHYYTLEEPDTGSYDICPVCYWEDDNVQFHDENFSGGANVVSLAIARKNFLEFGASEKRFINQVRDPLREERE